MFVAQRIIAFLLSLAVLAGTSGVPLVAAYCCDEVQSVAAYTHLCDGCGTDDGKDCCSTTVIIKKVEDSGYLPTNKYLAATDFFVALPVEISPDLIPSFSAPTTLSGAPVRGAPSGGRSLLALVCNLRL